MTDYSDVFPEENICHRKLFLGQKYNIIFKTLNIISYVFKTDLDAIYNFLYFL